MADDGGTHPEPDTKDWTWTLDRPCPDCGFACAEVPAHALAGRVLALTAPWSEVLAAPEAVHRPDPTTWSALEYGCHVRDVCRLFAQRTRLVLAEDGPTVENWDQDETAVTARYARQDPEQVAVQIGEAAADWASALTEVPDAQWGRPATRSDGSPFTLLTLGQYGLHDLAHHLGDVGVAHR